MVAPRKMVVTGCLGGVSVFVSFLMISHPVLSQEFLVRPEPAHLVTMTLGCGASPNLGAGLGMIGLVAAGQEGGLGIWRLTPPPGLNTSCLLGALLGVGAGNGTDPLPRYGGAISLLDLGHQYGLYQIVDPGKVLPLADFLLDQVRDREAIGESDYGAYVQAVVQAGRVSFDAFWRAGKSSLTRGDLMNRSSRLRGEVVRGQGVVRRIRRLEPLEDAIKQGVPDLYEAWIFQDLYGANPVCVVFPRLPQGLQPAENIQRPVQFAGYFLKAYRYQSAQTVQGKPVERDCPLLVGPELLALPEPAKPSSDMGAWPKTLLTVLLGTFAVAISLVWAMTWWMGRGDRRVRARLEHLKKANRSMDGPFLPPNSQSELAIPPLNWKEMGQDPQRVADSSESPFRVE